MIVLRSTGAGGGATGSGGALLPRNTVTAAGTSSGGAARACPVAAIPNKTINGLSKRMVASPGASLSWIAVARETR